MFFQLPKRKQAVVGMAPFEDFVPEFYSGGAGFFEE
jgi:hypothetical protein